MENSATYTTEIVYKNTIPRGNKAQSSSTVRVDPLKNLYINYKMHRLIVLLVFGFFWHNSLAREVNFSKNFKKIGEKYYHIQNDEKLDWSDARDKCRSMNGHLVSIKNFKEWDAITDHLTTCKSYWVDLKDIESNLEFISDTTGEAAPYLKWAAGEPSVGAWDDCVKLQLGCHCMKATDCSQENYYICEANMRPEVPPKRYEIIDLRNI